MNCHICSKPLDPTEPHYVQVQGWAKIRSEGGVNQVKSKSFTGRLAHITCVEHNFSPGLFDVAEAN